MKIPAIKIELPAWVESFVEWEKKYQTDEDKMALAVNLSLENIRQNTGGPFGAAIFEAETGKLLSVGMNQVVRLNNSALHAEVTAIMTAQQIQGVFSLNSPGAAKYELFTSCEPCCMCLGATLWSGVSRLVCAATKTDASKIGFDEGPVYESSYEYLESKGISVKRRFLRDSAVDAFYLYAKTGGIIYNR
ncbi:MAG: nucleoside deaminase [Acidobacteriota bacterium]|nr:nucleoside deaminase [Acidobacteriota bacterium]